MQRFLSTTGLAAGLIIGTAVSASAALLDFTTAATFNVVALNPAGGSGSIGGLTFTVTPSTTPLTFSEAGPGPIGPLAGDFDGLGIIDDEITTPPPETITVTFNRKVTITAAYFLDLFTDADGTETADVVSDLGGTDSFAASSSGGFGYGAFATSLVGKSFTFSVRDLNEDPPNLADAALAGINAQVPLPAGFILLGSALAGLGLARRRKA